MKVRRLPLRRPRHGRSLSRSRPTTSTQEGRLVRLAVVLGLSELHQPNGGNVIDCSIIVVDGNKNKLVNQICSTTVACCIGNGCIAIAE